MLATAALNRGDLQQLANGLVGAYAGLEPVAVGEQATFNLSGVFDVLCNSTNDAYVDGQPVHLDTTNKVALPTASATSVYLGTSVGTKVAGGSTVRVLLNGGGQPRTSAASTAIAAAGSTYADAAALGAQDIVPISSDGASKGVKLASGYAGKIVRVINTTATACKLYPATGGTVGAGTNTPVTIAASHAVICCCIAADSWLVQDGGAVLAS
jgi:hypothetical protein